MFYVNPRAIASLYGEIFEFGRTAEAMYCFTDSMRPLVQGPFSDEISRFLNKQNVQILAHQARWSGAVQFMHAVAKTPGKCDAADSLLNHVAPLVEAPINSYAPERTPPELSKIPEPSFNNSWYALAYSSELQPDTPYSTRLLGEPLTLQRDDSGVLQCRAQADGLAYVCAEQQGVIYVWRGAPGAADRSLLPLHPTPEATHVVETILDYGCDWKYIVENNLDTPHLYWLHDGSIPPIESLGCSRKNIANIGLRFFKDDIGVGHIGKTSKKVTKVVRYDAPNVVRHGGVSGFSEEFNIVPLGPRRTRVLLRQRFPKGPILSTLLSIPGTAAVLQYLVRNWNYQIGLEDYSVMQGQAHNIDDFGAPNWQATSTGDDLIIKFWRWVRAALEEDSLTDHAHAEYYQRYDGTRLDPQHLETLPPIATEGLSHGSGEQARERPDMREHYLHSAPIADYPPINFKGYTTGQGAIDALAKLPERLPELLPSIAPSTVLGASAGLVVGAELARAVHIGALTAL